VLIHDVASYYVRTYLGIAGKTNVDPVETGGHGD